MDFCVNGATIGAGEALAIDTKIHLLYTSGKQKCIMKGGNLAGYRFLKKDKAAVWISGKACSAVCLFVEVFPG